MMKMKTGIEYRKRNHRITQDEDKQTEEIELRKLRKSSVKVFILCYPVITLSVLCAFLHFIMMTMLVFFYIYF